MIRVIELRQLVGATTMAKGHSSHQIIKNAAKEEILVTVTLEDDADVDSGNDGCERASNTENDAHDDVIDLLHGQQCYLYCTNTVLAIKIGNRVLARRYWQYGIGKTVLAIRHWQYCIANTVLAISTQSCN